MAIYASNISMLTTYFHLKYIFHYNAPESHRSVALLISSQSHIPFRRSFTCNRLLGNKKAGTSKWYVPTLKGQGPPVKGKLVITSRCNRLWDSKSRPLFACSSANDAEMLRGKQRYFRLVYRRPYPTFSRRFFNNFVILCNLFNCSPTKRVF